MAIALLISSCGADRSVEAFCETYEAEAGRLGEYYSDQADVVQARGDGALFNLIMSVGMMVELQSDMIVFFDRLEKHAPEEIASDVVAVRDALQRQADSMGGVVGDPVDTLVASVVTSIQVNGSAQRVDSYIAENCLAS